MTQPPASAPRIVLLPALAAFALVILPSAALAQDAAETADAASTAGAAVEERTASWQLVPAVLLSYGGGASDNIGVGASLRLDHIPTALPLRIGGFATAEVLADGTVRIAGGMQGGFTFMGCQMGLAYRSGTDLFAGSLGLQIGKTIDFGGFSIGGRVTFPLVDFLDPNGGVTRTQGIEGQVVLTIGAALGLDGAPRRSCGCPHRGHGADAPVAIEEGVAEEAAAN